MNNPVVDLSLEVRVRELFDLVIASMHMFPEGLEAADLVALLKDRSTEARRLVAVAPQHLAPLVVTRVALAPYRLGPDVWAPWPESGSRLAADMVAAAPGPPAWVVRPRIAKGIGIQVQPRQPEERDRLIAACVEKANEAVERAGQAETDLAEIEERLALGQDGDAFAVFMHSARTFMSSLEREARGEEIPQWALEALAKAKAATNDETPTTDASNLPAGD